jgi:hypothetical protein
MKDGAFGGKSKIDHFYETRLDYGISSSIPDDDGTTQAFIGVYVTMDDTYKLTVRRVTTFSVAFASTGGFMGIVFLVALIAVRRVQEYKYNSKLIKKFYTFDDSSSIKQPNLSVTDQEIINSSNPDQLKKVVSKLGNRKEIRLTIIDYVKGFLPCSKS